jgi:hypothetical protein
MTVLAIPVTSNPLDGEEGIYVQNDGGATKLNFDAIAWTTARKTVESVGAFGVAKVVGAPAFLAKIADDVHLIDDIAIGDYIAYDSYIVWHIPAGDWSAQDIYVDGSVVEVDLED